MADQSLTTASPTNLQEPPAFSAVSHAPKTVKVMALVIAILCGAVGALAALVLTRHLGADALVAIGSSGVTFLGVTGTVTYAEEKLGLL
ncbi:hypothetical protein [Streptomyces xanthophaeus]